MDHPRKGAIDIIRYPGSTHQQAEQIPEDPAEVLEVGLGDAGATDWYCDWTLGVFAQDHSDHPGTAAVQRPSEWHDAEDQ